MEGAAVVGHGDGGCRLLATAREAVELFAPLDGIEVFHNVERERQEEEKKVVGSGVVCCRVLSAGCLGRQRYHCEQLLGTVSRRCDRKNSYNFTVVCVLTDKENLHLQWDSRNILTAIAEKQRELRAVSLNQE